MEIEKFLNTLQNRNQAVWADVRRHLQNCFMSQHEEEKLRDDLEKICRQPYETTAHYGRRFSEAADLAYPAAQRNADQQKTMLRRYMKGLGDEKLVLRLVQERDPADYLEAIEAVAKFESDAYQVYRAVNGVAPPERQIEPMDISAVSQRGASAAPPRSNETHQQDRMESLERQISGLSREFTRMMAINRRDAQPARRENQRGGSRRNELARERRPEQQAPVRRRQYKPIKFTDDGRPICLRCERVGHMKRECPLPAGPSRSAGPSRQRQGEY